MKKRTVSVLAAELGSFASRTSEKVRLRGAKAVVITVVLANKAGTVSFTPKVRRYLADGTTAVDLWTAAAALSANGTVMYALGELPAGTLTAGYTEGKAAFLPELIDVVLTVSGAGDGNEFDTRVEMDIYSD